MKALSQPTPVAGAVAGGQRHISEHGYGPDAATTTTQSGIYSFLSPTLPPVASYYWSQSAPQIFKKYAARGVNRNDRDAFSLNIPMQLGRLFGNRDGYTADALIANALF